jgi:hypothetical protein
MRSSQQFRMSITRRGEKELLLGAFIARGVATLAAPRQGAELLSTERAVLVIARSLQSPVVTSIAALAREIAAAGCGVRMILARMDRSAPSSLFIAAQAAALDCEVRQARNPRLIEAHEQLVLGTHTCWTGDTMRRDPGTCDAYESFVEDCAWMAAAAATTFERFWADGEPLSDGVLLADAAAAPKVIGPERLLARRT